MIATRAGSLCVGIDRLDEARALLQIPNAAYEQALKMRERGRRMPLPPEFIDPVVVEGDTILVPRWAPLPAESVSDRRVRPVATPYPVPIVLRDYQQAAVTAWVTSGGNGVIQAPCGAGKTIIGLSVVCRCPTPALVVVHTGDLLDQWVQQADRWGIPVERIEAGTGLRSGRLVIATVQSLSRLDPKELFAWGSGFGLVLTDEAHHVPAETWGQVLYQLPGRFRLALTATPEREDGLTPLLHWHAGPVVAEIRQVDLVAAGIVLAPVVCRVRTGWVPTKEDWGQILTEASEDVARNSVILTLAERLARRGRHVLIQTERTAHAQGLVADLSARGIRAAALYGQVTAKKRADILDKARDGRIQVIAATQLADEGLDLPILDSLILGLPQRHPARLQQRVGRVSRVHPEKAGAEVYDLIDEGTLQRLWWPRLKVYRNLGCDEVQDEE